MVHYIFFACTIWLLNLLPNFVAPFIVCGFNYNLKSFLVQVILVEIKKILNICQLAYKQLWLLPEEFHPKKRYMKTSFPIPASRPHLFPGLNTFAKLEQKISGEKEEIHSLNQAKAGFHPCGRTPQNLLKQILVYKCVF